MKKMSSNEIRKMFLDYFKAKDHFILESASLIPSDDRSLLWNNAGITPLKKYFDGRETPPYKRLVNVQKCIRTNDIENVGKTARHHTFFEMLGNFSIGDYFKKEAIGMALELLTSSKYFDLDINKLYITVHTKDEEAKNIWISLGIKENHIIKFDSNFWQIGQGPSGFDSEIMYDRGKEYDPKNIGIKLLTNEIENDRYVEIWNIVFSQYNYKPGVELDKLEELPNKNIDTGLGLERLVSIIQNTKTNYETDLFMPIINEIQKHINKKYEDNSFEFKVIADHIRTLVFALSDNALFSNEGRGYVLRRVLRRASRCGKNIGFKEPFLYKLVDIVVENMKDIYPEIVTNNDKIKDLIKKEETMFLKTLTSGEKKLQSYIENKKISGEEIFKLYDTYGFPYELTEEILKENGIYIDKEEFDKYMSMQKELSRKNNKDNESMNQQSEIINFKEKSIFVGYSKTKIKAKVICIISNNKIVNELSKEGYVILDKTPFYATLGGQICDTGIIYNKSVYADVLDIEKSLNDQNIHKVYVKKGVIKLGTIITAKIDNNRRKNISINHTATHLLNKALKQVLSSDIKQAGSSIDDKKLRFDFNYPKDISDNELIEVENIVNNYINKKHKIDIKNMKLNDAINLGASAIFTEKYKEDVRVVKVDDSSELCGGTHIKNTKEIRKFAIISCESKGLNIYRIEAVTKDNIYNEAFKAIKPYNDDMKLLLIKAKKTIETAANKGIILNVDLNISNERPDSYKDIVENKIELVNLKQAVQDLEKRYNDKLIEYEISKANKLLKDVYETKYGSVLISKTQDISVNILKSIIDNLLNNFENGIIFIINISDNKNINIIGKKREAYKKDINIGNIVKIVSNMIDGNGGGNALFGQGGGTNTQNINKVIDYIKKEVE